MPRTKPQPDGQKTFTLMLLVVAVAALYFAADVLMPLALAVLLTFILAPLVNRLERLRMGRVPSVLVAVGAAFALLFSIGWVVGNQMVDLAYELPTYQDNIVHRIQKLKRSETGPLSRFEQAVKDFTDEIAAPPKNGTARSGTNHEAAGKAAKAAQASADGSRPAAEQAPPADSNEPQPVPVEIVQPQVSPYSVLSGILPGAFGWLATAGIVVVFTIFMLLEREDMRNRLIRLIGPDQITVTTQALDDAAGRVSRYLRMQLIINASYGLMLAGGLYFIGLPNAITWGLFGGMLRYLPYVGPWLGASVGILLSLAVFDTWTEPLLTIALFLSAELIVNNVLEPVLYHSTTGISTVGILVAAVFWTWLWGPVGLVLSTPLTVCIAVMGRYVPDLQFLNVLLTDEQVLPPGVHLYQRLLVSDELESRELVEAYLHDHSRDELFEHVLLPAVVLAEQDGRRGILEDARRQYILENVQDMLDELPEQMPDQAAEAPQRSPAQAGRPVLIVPARDEADHIAGLMLEWQLAERHIDARLLPARMLFSEIVDQLGGAPSPLVVVSAVPPFSIRHARHLVKRLRARLNGVGIVVAVWGEKHHARRTDARLTAAGADRVVVGLGPAVEVIQRHLPERPKSNAPQAAGGSGPLPQSEKV